MFEAKLFQKADPGHSRVIAVFSYRNDAHLVPDFIANICPFIDGYVSWDDRGATEELTSEPERRNRLLSRAREMGARWILALDPDERVEASLSRRLPKMLAMGESNIWSFPIREMFTPDTYRIDGVWGRKRRISLFPVSAIGQDLLLALHGGWIGDRSAFRLRDAATNIYHLRMATPERRRIRRELYAAADPARRFQAIGYDFLDDERGIVLEKIPEGREFQPAFIEDHGLWSPDPGKIGKVNADPPKARLNYAADALSKCASDHASFAFQDLASANPDDPDFLPIAAMLALTACAIQRTKALASSVLERFPDNALALYVRGKAAAAVGDQQGLLSDCTRLRDIVGNCHLSQDLQSEISRPSSDFCQSDAKWRQWVPGAAHCREGQNIANAPMSVVVIGYKAEASLAAAVSSLRAQDSPCEIVVVNSGGGPVESVLATHLDHIRLITTDVPLYVGAARNIGIEASRGKIIGFLAGDCQALPGWVSGRLREHDLGARSVSNPVVPEPGANRLATASLSSRHRNRRPLTKLASVSHYGRSYTREALALAGYFPTGLRVGEDTDLNKRIDLLKPCVWAPDVLTTHKEPETFWKLILDNFSRGQRLSDHPPFRPQPGEAWKMRKLWVRLLDRYVLPSSASIDRTDFDQEIVPGHVLIGLLITVSQFLGLLRGLRRKAKADRAQLRAGKALLETSVAATDKAILKDIRKAVALDPQDPRKWLLLGEVLVLQGLDGTEAFRKALEIDPTMSEPLSHLTGSFLSKGDFANALATAESLARQAPQSSAHWQAAADIATQAGKAPLAVAYAQRALSLEPNLATAHAKVADLYRKIGNLAAAAHRHATADQHHGDPEDRNAM